MSSIVFATELDTDTEDTVIVTRVPATHDIKIQSDGNGKVFYRGLVADNITVDRMSEPTILIRGESNYVTDKVTLDGFDITEKIKGGYYTFDKIHKDNVVKVSFKAAERGSYKFHLSGTIHKNDEPLMNTLIELRSELDTSRTDKNGTFAFSDVEEGHHSVTAVDDNNKIIAYTEFRLIRDKSVSGIDIRQNADGFFDIRIHMDYDSLKLAFKLTEDGRLMVVSGVGHNDSDGILDPPLTGVYTPIISYLSIFVVAIGVIIVLIKKK